MPWGMPGILMLHHQGVDHIKPAAVRHLLVLGGGDLLQEVGDALALRQRKAYCGEEGQHLIARAMEHHVTCASGSTANAWGLTPMATHNHKPQIQNLHAGCRAPQREHHDFLEDMQTTTWSSSCESCSARARAAWSFRPVQVAVKFHSIVNI